MMDRLNAMNVFAAVAREGGFAAAARHLHMSPAAVTRAIAALEDNIGTRLFARTTRRVSLTEAGARYLHDCERILSEIDEAEAAAAGLHANPTGLLSITAPVLFGRFYVGPILTEFLDQHENLAARLLLLDRVSNLVEEGIDIAIRIGSLPDSGLAAIRVGTVRRVVCASPAYLKQHGVPQTPAALKDRRIIAATNVMPSDEWRFGRDGRTHVKVKPRLYCNNNAAAITLAEQGWGLTRLLSYQLGPSISEGRLRLVLEEFEEPPLPVHIVHSEGRRASAKVRAFVDFSAEKLRMDPLVNPRI